MYLALCRERANTRGRSLGALPRKNLHRGCLPSSFPSVRFARVTRAREQIFQGKSAVFKTRANHRALHADRTSIYPQPRLRLASLPSNALLQPRFDATIVVGWLESFSSSTRTSESIVNLSAPVRYIHCLPAVFQYCVKSLTRANCVCDSNYYYWIIILNFCVSTVHIYSTFVHSAFIQFAISYVFRTVFNSQRWQLGLRTITSDQTVCNNSSLSITG